MTIEEAWNAYPLCKTKFTCPFLDKFFIEVETRFYDNDRGEQVRLPTDLRCSGVSCDYWHLHIT